MRTLFRTTALAALLMGAAACNETTFVTDGGERPSAPTDLRGEYVWELEGFSGTQPVGYHAVKLNWLPPTRWNQEPFRVYGKRRSAADYTLIATVSSCTDKGCTYTDRNVAPGIEYQYYVATVNERSNEEANSATSEVVFVRNTASPAAPQTRAPVALDDAVYLRWTGVGASAARYRVYLTRIDGRADYLYPVGESDGTGYVDLNAENGHVYGYRLATVDTAGRVGPLSAEITAVPRPDRTAELVYGFQDNAAQSGFRYNVAAGTAQVVSGSAADAHWRLERDGAGWRIVPLNGVRVVDAGRTTALSCGPASGAECVAVTTAPATGFVSTPLPLSPEISYVLAVPGASGAVHYSVVRVQLLGSDQQGRALMVFDWSLQQRANEPRLIRAQ
jgi:hypothetical protein